MAAAKAKGKPQKPPPIEHGDILSQKGYYDNLVVAHEDIIAKRDVLNKDIEVETVEKEKLEKQIKELQDFLSKMGPSIKKKKKDLDKMDKKLADLQADPRKAAAKMKYEGMDDQQRADFMRNEFNQRMSIEPEDKPLNVSSTPRGHGPEAVEVQNMSATESEVPIRCYISPGKSIDASPAPPAIVFFHGGGFVMGDLDTHDGLCRSLCALSGCTVVSVDYRRAPEHKWPAALDDCYGVLQWVSGGGLGAAPRKLAVAGDCSGGGLAVSCCLRARGDPQAPKVALKILVCPWLDLRPTSPALTCELSDGRYGLCEDDLEYFTSSYEPEYGADSWTEQASASPLAANSFDELPRTFIAYSVTDMLECDATTYITRLRTDIGPEAVHTMRVDGPEHFFASKKGDPHAHHVLSSAATFASAVLWLP